jgi:hypothetical protein
LEGAVAARLVIGIADTGIVPTAVHSMAAPKTDFMHIVLALLWFVCRKRNVGVCQKLQMDQRVI